MSKRRRLFDGESKHILEAYAVQQYGRLIKFDSSAERTDTNQNLLRRKGLIPRTILLFQQYVPLNFIHADQYCNSCVTDNASAHVPYSDNEKTATLEY